MKLEINRWNKERRGSTIMKADSIKEIIRKMEELPYKAILFDGVWGIGKSYAIDEALEGNDNVCKISMFGLNNASEIYHEILFQLALKKSAGGKISKMVNNVMGGLSVVWGKVGQAKNNQHYCKRTRIVFAAVQGISFSAYRCHR